MPAAITMPLIIAATNMVATTRGATSRSSGSTPRTSMASISSRILRAPMSLQIAEPAAPAMMRAAAIGAASRTVASTAVAPAKDWAPSWPVRLPTWSEMTAPKGIDTRIVGISVTLVMNHACSTNSRNWKGRVKIRLVTSTTIAAISPGPRKTDTAVNAIGLLPIGGDGCHRLERVLVLLNRAPRSPRGTRPSGTCLPDQRRRGSRVTLARVDDRAARDVWASFQHDPRDPAVASLRASDADRNIVHNVLTEAFADGRLDREEYDERTAATMAARTLAQLPPLVADLVPDRPLLPATVPLASASTAALAERAAAAGDGPTRVRVDGGHREASPGEVAQGSARRLLRLPGTDPDHLGDL